MSEIVLATLNAKFIHASFGLRYLMANLGSLQSRSSLVEFDINQRPIEIVGKLLALEPRIIGFGIYIWNVSESTQVVAALKRLRPELQIILGGPEVSYECQSQPIVALADYVITGEADLKFAEICEQLLRGEPPPQKVVAAELPELSRVKPPYEYYQSSDIAHRIVYVEASRGCPFTCEFCLSSLDIPVRQFPLDAFLQQMQRLFERGLKHFKFVDRTFNLNLNTSRAILEFLLARYEPGHLYHFEMIPDRLPDELKELIRKFPAGALQFEVGVQTFNEEVGRLIQRRQNYQRLEENFLFLRRETGVHIHADLIAGLPGESLESFGAGFDRLIRLAPQEIQVGLLKRLRGTPIVRHDESWGMIYNPYPPYELLQNKLMDFATMQRLRRFARYWDLVGNSGNFRESVPRLWRSPVKPGAGQPEQSDLRESSPFDGFMRWSDWLHHKIRRTDSIALVTLMELFFEYLTRELGQDPLVVAECLWGDYQRGGRRHKPEFLRGIIPPDPKPAIPMRRPTIKRQARHLAR